MSIEAATYIADLQPVNPPSSDPRSQGDDHLRLIKQVLQNSIVGSSRPFNIPSTLAKTANYSVLKTDGESVIYANTGAGAVTFTLPTLVAADAGWKVHFIKTSTDVNPMFIAPPAGTLTSGQFPTLAKARRCIPGVQVTAVWDGTNFFVTRATALPPGTMMDFDGSTLPAGFEWPNGQTLASAATNYPEYNAAKGSGATRDLRGFIAATLDNLGGVTAGNLPTTFIAATTLGSTGGTDHSTLATTNLPAYTPTGSVSTSTSISHNAAVNGGGSGTPGPFTAPLNAEGAATISASSSSTFTGNAQGGASTAFSNLQPTIMLGKILVVE